MRIESVVMPLKFSLTKQEATTPVWAKLKAQIEARLEISRKQNDGDLSEVETARLRGRIAAYKELLGADPDNQLTGRPTA